MLNIQERSLHRRYRRHYIQILGYNQVPDSLKYLVRTGLIQSVPSHVKSQKGYREKTRAGDFGRKL
jgi:hypothetical protein